MKSIIKTKSAIMLVDPVTQEIVEETPHVVTWTSFLEARTGKGQIAVLKSDLPRSANDDDFQQFLTDAEDETLAVASYASSFEVSEPEGEPKPKPEPEPDAPKAAAKKSAKT